MKPAALKAFRVAKLEAVLQNSGSLFASEDMTWAHFLTNSAFPFFTALSILEVNQHWRSFTGAQSAGSNKSGHTAKGFAGVTWQRREFII